MNQRQERIIESLRREIEVVWEFSRGSGDQRRGSQASTGEGRESVQ